MIALGALTLVPDMTLPIVVEFDRALVTSDANQVRSEALNRTSHNLEEQS